MTSNDGGAVSRDNREPRVFLGCAGLRLADETRGAQSGGLAGLAGGGPRSARRPPPKYQNHRRAPPADPLTSRHSPSRCTQLQHVRVQEERRGHPFQRYCAARGGGCPQEGEFRLTNGGVMPAVEMVEGTDPVMCGVVRNDSAGCEREGEDGLGWSDGVYDGKEH